MDFVSVLGLVSVLVSRTGDESGLWTWDELGDEWIVDFVNFVSLALGLGAGLGAGLGDKAPGSRYSTLIS